ncbi:MAG: type 4a pilus biogenesis protein PilO [Arenicellales bacterium WSBS_2016_MAG_OTU3]
MALDIHDIDIKDLSTWPTWLKVIGVIFVAGLLVAASWYFFLDDEIKNLEKARADEQQLRKTFLARKELAVNLPAYRVQMEEIEDLFAIILNQLPDRTEVPALLVDITQAGLARGLDFELFKPQTKLAGEFYVTLPIDVRVTGPYHVLAEFVSDLAALPRIVSLGDLKIEPAENTENTENNTSILTMQAVAKTFHYLNEAEIAAQRESSGTARTAKTARTKKN